jgi:hypothetical protein
MPLDAPRRWTGPPPPEGSLTRGRVRDVKQTRSPHYEVKFHEPPPILKTLPTDDENKRISFRRTVHFWLAVVRDLGGIIPLIWVVIAALAGSFVASRWFL